MDAIDLLILHMLCIVGIVSTPKTRFSEPRFSEILNLMNKLQLPFSYFTLYSDSILVNRLNLVNKRGLTTADNYVH